MNRWVSSPPCPCNIALHTLPAPLLPCNPAAIAAVPSNPFLSCFPCLDCNFARTSVVSPARTQRTAPCTASLAVVSPSAHRSTTHSHPAPLRPSLCATLESPQSMHACALSTEILLVLKLPPAGSFHSFEGFSCACPYCCCSLLARPCLDIPPLLEPLLNGAVWLSPTFRCCLACYHV